MDKIFNKAPELIREAAKSTRGIVALVIFTISVLALAFFTTASETVRVGIFVLVFVGAGLFVMSMLRLAKLEQSQTTLAELPSTGAGYVAALDQVAAICYRTRGSSIEFLLVKTDGGRWTFPKGRINKDEDLWRAAERTAFDEAGVSGEIRREPLATYLHLKQGFKQLGIEIRVVAFPLRVQSKQVTKEKGRRPTWYSPREAEEVLSKDRDFKYAQELKKVVRQAVSILI